MLVPTTVKSNNLAFRLNKFKELFAWIKLYFTADNESAYSSIDEATTPACPKGRLRILC